MRKLLQINVCSNLLSTGRIVEDIAKTAVDYGWESYIAYGRSSRPSISNEVRIGSKKDVYLHYLADKLWDCEGLASRRATKELILKIKEIQPDIIHLHNIHDHYLNYPLLFEFLIEYKRPVVWTQHDCWAFTGGCHYFDITQCEEWKNQCNPCRFKSGIFGSRSSQHFKLKQELFAQIRNLTYIPVSNWMGKLIEESVQGKRRIVTIHNGIDTTRFRILNVSKSISDHFTILGVAAVWDKRKGLSDFIQLRSMLPLDKFSIVLVGLSNNQISKLPTGIKGIKRTTNVEELVRLYNDANIFVNPTYSDNFPTTNLEALACGTPVITYRTGGSPEAVDEDTGIVIEKGDISALKEAIISICNNPLSAEKCRERAVKLFEKSNSFVKYIELYDSLLNS